MNPRLLAFAVAFATFAALPGLASAQTPPTVKVKGGEARADRFLVRLGKHADAATAARTMSQRLPEVRKIRTYPKLAGLGVIEMKTARANAAAVEAELARLRATGMFEVVEPDYIVRTFLAPTDAAFTDGRLWGLRNVGQSGGLTGADIGAESAWDVTTGSTQVVVAVIDTGIRYTHQDLAANMWRNPGELPGNGVDDDANGYVDDVHGINAITGSGNPMDDNDHGTHCAGTIGAVANGGGPHVGVAWNVRLMALKFLAADGSGSTSDAIECIDYAISKGARILNNSWGGGGESTLLREAIARANSAGALFVAAAGNERNDNDRGPTFPANYDVPNVVSVAALDRNDQLASFSNFGATQVDLGAPGVDIFSATSRSDTSYESFNGTSMATPHVAGVAALLLARQPTATVAELRTRLLQSTVSVPALQGRCVTGGRVNARAALDAGADGILELQASASPSPLSSGQSGTFFVRVSDFLPVTGATVTANLNGGAAATFRDNGLSPDAVAGDALYTAILPVPPGTATLNVTASAPGKTAAQRAFTFPVSSPPPNDAFAAAIATAPGAVQSTGSNVNASSETAEPRNPSSAGGRTVWWTWQAPTSGPVTFSTSGSNFDTTLAVYTGATLASLTLVAANDDSDGLQSAVTFTAVGGVTYRVQVDGYSSATGDVVLNHPATGDPNGPPVIMTEPADTSVLLGQPFELRVVAAGAGLTYRWFFENQEIPNETSATLARSAAALADQGRYRVDVTNAQGTTPSREAFVSVQQVGIAPGSDAFAAATLLSGAGGRVTGTNRQATGEVGEPDHAGASLPLASVWHRWVAPANGAATFTTNGSDFDTTLAVYRGGSLPSLTLVGSNDDAPGSRQSRVNFEAIAGETYWIAIDGFEAAVGNLVLDYALGTSTPVPANDAFAAREILTTLAQSSNLGATEEPGEPEHAAGSRPLHSLWWQWTAPADGTVTFRTDGSDFDTTLAVYAGEAVGQLTPIAENDDAGGVTSRVSLAVAANQTFALAVDGYGSAQGQVRLAADFQAANSVEPTPGPAVLRFASRRAVALPDARRTTVGAIFFPAGTVNSVDVEMVIRHSHLGDLRILLVAPNGRTVTLFAPRSSERSTRLNLRRTVRAIRGAPVNGAWRLVVIDRAPRDAGRLLRWSLALKVAP